MALVAMSPLLKIVSVIVGTVVGHWALVQLYVSWCAPSTWWGPVKAFISLGSPVCHFINKIQFELAQHYVIVWAGAAAGLVAWLIAGVA